VKQPPTFVYRFDDGEEYRLTAQQVREQLDRQIVALISSGEPDLVAAGTRQLKALSSLATDAEIEQLFREAIAKRPRKKDPTRAAIIEAMKPRKADGKTFKGFIREWENNPISGLVLAVLGDSFSVYNENTGQEKAYQLAGLEALWKTAGSKKGR